jgi:hypothetical protein
MVTQTLQSGQRSHHLLFNYERDNFRKGISEDIVIPKVETGLKLGYTPLGLGRDNFIYLNFAFIGEEYWQSEGVNVYDLNGSLVATISLDINQLDQDYAYPDVQLSPSGYLYQMWVSKNGVHIYKWSNSK